jgi:DNA-binding MarR family transcriptional regulator
VREIPLFSLFLCSGDVIAEKIERGHSCLIFLLLRGNPHGEGNLIYHRQSSLFLERMLQVASTVVLSRSGLTRLVDRLEAEGVLLRDRSRTDRRGAYAVITEQGIAAMRRTWPIYAKGIAEYFAQWLTLEEAQLLEAAFGRILQAAANK